MWLHVLRLVRLLRLMRLLRLLRRVCFVCMHVLFYYYYYCCCSVCSIGLIAVGMRENGVDGQLRARAFGPRKIRQRCIALASTSNWLPGRRRHVRRAKRRDALGNDPIDDARGQRLSFVLFNAMHMTSNKWGPTKAQGITKMLRDMLYPSLVAITEVGKPAGTVKLPEFFGPELEAQYRMVWSQRSASLNGGTPGEANKVGGGIALLIHKRLWVTVSEFHLNVSEDEKILLDGHLRVFRLDPVPAGPVGAGSRPRPHAMRRPIIVTVAYIPPVGEGWGKKVRPTVFSAIADADAAIRQLRRRQDVFTITLAHTNAPDGGCPVELKLEHDQRPFADIEAELQRCRPPRPGTIRATIALTPDGRRILHRTRSAEQATSTSAEGCRMVARAAEAGKVALSGVMGHRQATSWPLQDECAECQAGRSATCATLVGARAANTALAQSGKRGKRQIERRCKDMLSTRVHDVVFVPDYLVYQALRSPSGGRKFLSQCTRRIKWAGDAPQDHAVTYGHVLVGPMLIGGPPDASSVAPGGGSAPTNEQRMPKRYRPSDNLLSKTIELNNLCAIMNRNMFKVLATPQGSEDEMEKLGAGFTALTLEASTEARATAAQKELDESTGPAQNSLRLLRAEYHAARAELTVAAEARPSGIWKKNRTAAQNQRWSHANKVCRIAHQALKKAEKKQYAAEQAYNHRRAPKKFWRGQLLTATEMGLEDSTLNYLLDHQNDDGGQFLTSDPAQLRRNMQDNRATTYAMRSEAQLGASCRESIDEALVALHFENRELLAANPAMQGRVSAVAHSASDPCAPTADADHRRGVQRDLGARLRDFETQRAVAPTRGQLVHRNFPGAAARLNRDVSRQEVHAVCAKLKNVGSGVDGAAPVALALQTEDSKTVTALTRLFTLCFATGTQPQQWRVHRTLLLYKGKGTDPYCLKNFRGLGIDTLGCKIWALLLMERLEEFLGTTRGLSRMQGGFQRQKGPPEQAFTLSETVRSSTRRQQVFITFLDIEQAYDTVVRPILWKRCLDKGIDGRFLGSLQAMYFMAEAQIDVNGVLLPPVPLEVGVLQGNPLSPALFNIYIDGAIEALSQRGAVHLLGPFGINLPRAVDGPAAAGAAADPGESLLPCLYFADDGALLAYGGLAMQAMLDITMEELAKLGLVINVKKTKWMVVPPHWVKEKDYFARVKPLALAQPLRVYQQPIELVDEFDYLGITVWWRWDWTRAWATAHQRARKAFFGARRAGWQHRAGSLNSQMEYARAKIFCHFNYIAALTGTDAASTATTDQIAGWVLQSVSGQRFASVEALRIEAGVWSWQARGDMLLLRMWCKYLAMPKDSVAYRAICLSISNTPSGVQWRMDAHAKPWARHLVAAADRFGIAADRVRLMQHDLAVLLVDQVNDGHLTEVSPATVLGPLSVLRIGVAGSTLWQTDVNCWRLPIGTVLAEALQTWSPQLKAAVYAALKGRGNLCRQRVVREFLIAQVQNHTRLKTWASTISGSFEQPYWRLTDVTLARRLCALRLDCCPTEDHWRWRPHGALQRIPVAAERACYLCDAIDPAVPAVYWPESLAHVLITCTCPALVAVRDRFQQAITALAGDVATRCLADAARAPCPDFTNATVLLSCMQLCVGAGPSLVTAPMAVGPAAGSLTQVERTAHACRRRAAPPFDRESQMAAATARWVRALTDDWCDIHRNVRRRDPPALSPGGRLVQLVAAHAVAAFAARRALLKTSVAFQARARDPNPPSASQPGAGGGGAASFAADSSEPPSLNGNINLEVGVSVGVSVGPASIAEELIVRVPVVLSSPNS